MRILVYGASGTLYGGIESFLLNMNDHMSDGCIFDYVIVGASLSGHILQEKSPSFSA